MAETRRAARALEAHLEEVMEVEDAALVVGRFERTVTEDVMQDALDRQSADVARLLEHQNALIRQLLEHHTALVHQEILHQADRLRSEWRRDLMLVTGVQFAALIGVVTAFVGG